MGVADRISSFKFIRDIPYRIGLTPLEVDYSCATKSVMLGKLLEGMGLRTQQIICTFAWEETQFPKEILALPRGSDVSHQFLQVLIPETKKWINVDPTWDAPLVKLGFSVSEWDGLNETSLAIKPHKIFTSDETRDLIQKYSDPLLIEEYQKFHFSFHKAMNDFLASARSSV